ncbi:MAG: M56 family metallopeptidase [Allosphingosinicella sp.]
MTYEFLIEMAWKSAAIAGGALLLASLLRSRAAADRGAVLKVAVALLLALPAIALFAPALQIETPPAAPAPVAATAPATPAASLPEAVATPVAFSDEDSVATRAGGDWNDPSLLFFLLYAGGALTVVGRLLVGLWILARWTREAREVEAPEWRSALARAGGDSLGIRLLQSDEAGSPLSWGWRRPVILLDGDTLKMPGDADAILAHEVAHVARRDWPSLILSRLTVALFWFNPLVWRLDREVAQQAEEAADSDAATQVEPARYAQTLLDWARLSGANALPANAIAAGEPGLSRRVKAILDGRIGRRSGSFWAVAAMLGCAAFAAPVAALEFVPEAPEAPAAPPALPAAPTPLAAVAPVAPLAPLPPRAAPHAAPAPLAPPAPLARAASLLPRDAQEARAAAQLGAAAEVRARAEDAARGAVGADVDEAAINAEVERSVAEAMRSVEAVTAEASRVAEHAVEAAMAGVAAGSRGMEAGADGMERGAARMREEARRLRDPAYRAQKIRDAAAHGRQLSDKDLIDAADSMEDGAQGMVEGAREMREAAAGMRRKQH